VGRVPPRRVHFAGLQRSLREELRSFLRYEVNAATKVAKAAKGAEVVKESTRFLAAVGGQREGSEDSLSISQRRRRLSQARRRPLDCCASQLVENDSDGSVGKRET